MIVLSAALIEEIGLRSRFGEEYTRYVKQAPFMIPMPSVLVGAIKYPARIIVGKRVPETRGEVLIVSCIYLALIMIISLFTSYLVA